MHITITDRTAIISILAARVSYAVNWFNIASIFPLIAKDLDEDIVSLGIISASFLVGVGLFQIIGGTFAARAGPKKTAVYGVIVASSAALASGVSYEVYQIAILRFIVGAGMAFFFGPGVTLVARHLGKKREGLGIGMLNAAQAFGGVIGLVGWAAIAEVTGWRLSLIIGGVIGLASGIMLYLFIPVEKNQQLKPNTGEIIKIILNRQLVTLGIVLLGIQTAWNIIMTFTVFYLQDNFKIGAMLGSFVSSLTLLAALVSAPFFGKIYDRVIDIRIILLVCGALISIGVAIVAFNTVAAIIISAIVVGFFGVGGFTIAYSDARRIGSGMDAKYETLAVSWVNGISLFGVLWVPILFSFIVTHSSYITAWLVGGIMTMMLIVIPAIKVERTLQ